jgi:hypothetical protein
VKLPDAWNAPPLILNVNPVLPVADAAILPFVPPAVVGFVEVPVTTTVTPEQGLGGLVTVNVDVPVQPLEFFAITV